MAGESGSFGGKKVGLDADPGYTGRRYTTEYKRLALWKAEERVSQGETTLGFCQEIGHARATQYRWKTQALQGKIGRPKPEGEIAKVMEWEVRSFDRSKDGHWGTKPMYEALGAIIPRSKIDEVLDERRKAEGRVSRPHSRGYEFVAPRVAYSTDFVSVRPRGRVLRIQDERARYTLGFAHNDHWPEAEVAAFIRTIIFKHGIPLFFKHDRGPEFRSGVVQDLLRSFLIIAVPSPPYYPRFNGKNERANRSAREWIAPTEADRPSLAHVIEKFTQGTLDQNDMRKRGVLGGRTSEDVFKNDPGAKVDRQVLYSDWDAQREEILRRYSPDGERREAAELEAMRLAALVVVKKYNLVKYPEKPEAPKVSG